MCDFLGLSFDKTQNLQILSESRYPEIHQHTLEGLITFYTPLNGQLYDYIGEKFDWNYSNIERSQQDTVASAVKEYKANIEDCWG